ncbi:MULTISPECIES: class III extradiol dioxygenase subunit B-like domain-containing protein [Streptomyces]|uniref:class III extradiol dioxygenase subunit B-like domain-containing protein n=1 Tax=Streptomyces TaxID=1883 RepID=UPI001F22CDD8|nr:class III extradiol dioxygenase subunit B-like domain-containing protein [Streptomyces violaceoruber]MCF3171598.1 class III extradiol dioxygenase subunit B-like domain-containing protein [Streptomyces violaceoruber]
MLVAAAVCPCPPLLVPEVAAGAAPELDSARDACLDAVAVLAASRPDLLVVVGPGETLPGRDGAPSVGPFPPGTHGSFRGVGVDLDVTLGPVPEEAFAPGRPLPQSLTVGAWLLGRARWSGSPVEGLALPEAAVAEDCAEAGGMLARRAGRVALLVMGDGSACRTLKAPGYLDERAADFDARATEALGSADLDALAALDVTLAHELKVAGRAPWQLLAGAARDAGLAGRLLYEGAPYGVGYTVAAWS